MKKTKIEFDALRRTIIDIENRGVRPFLYYDGYKTLVEITYDFKTENEILDWLDERNISYECASETDEYSVTKAQFWFKDDKMATLFKIRWM